MQLYVKITIFLLLPVSTLNTNQLKFFAFALLTLEFT